MRRNVITAEIGEAIKIAHTAGIGLREFARNKGIPEGTVLAYAHRKGLTQQIASAKVAANPKLARDLAQPDAINEIKPWQAVATTMQQRGTRHVERMAGVSENVAAHVAGMKPGVVLDKIHEVEKFDRIARRTFGLSDSAGGGSLSVNILTRQAVVCVSADNDKGSNGN